MKEIIVPWMNYFDDFAIFAKADEVASVTGSIKFVFEALGWLFAEDGDKAPDFACRVTPHALWSCQDRQQGRSKERFAATS